MRPGFPEPSYRPGRPDNDPALRVAPLRVAQPVRSVDAAAACGAGASGSLVWSAAAGTMRLMAALLGGLLLLPTARASAQGVLPASGAAQDAVTAPAPEAHGAAANLGGVILLRSEGDDPQARPGGSQAASPPEALPFNRFQLGGAAPSPPTSSVPGTAPAAAAELPQAAAPAASSRAPQPRLSDLSSPPSQAPLTQARVPSDQATPRLSPEQGAGATAAAPNPEPGVLVPRAGDLGNDQPIRPATPDSRPPGAAAAAAATSSASQRELVLDRRRRQLLVIENGTPLRRFPVAVGMPGWETPVGRFAVIEMQTNPTWEHPVSGLLIQPGPDNPLGSRWIGFHRDCSGRSGFNGKEHLVVQGCVVAGFHGTPNRSSIGQAVSHGCVRLYDEHVRVLFDLVGLGTPVTVLP